MFKPTLTRASRQVLLAAAVWFSLSGAAFAAIDVNTADEAALVSLKGIGPATASTIVTERSRGGPFKDAADLADRVKGLGQKSVVRLQEAGMTIGAGGAAAPKAAATAPKAAVAAAAPARKDAKAETPPAKAAR